MAENSITKCQANTINYYDYDYCIRIHSVFFFPSQSVVLDLQMVSYDLHSAGQHLPSGNLLNWRWTCGGLWLIVWWLQIVLLTTEISPVFSYSSRIGIGWGVEWGLVLERSGRESHIGAVDWQDRRLIHCVMLVYQLPLPLQGFHYFFALHCLF